MELSLAFTPCPNDTFMFYSLATGKRRLPGVLFNVTLADVETLNQRALQKTYDLSKISFHAWLKVQADYRLLSAGAALGYGCGPLIISKKPLRQADLPHCRVAIPGDLTTAHLLLQLWAPKVKEKIFVPYNEIFQQLEAGTADCGLIIHESRFTYEQQGFNLVVDLGAWWESITGLPLPLGCIVARRELPALFLKDFEASLRASIEVGRSYPFELLDYMKKHAQELDETVIKEHVATYVNDYSLELGTTGNAAIAKLEELARAAGVI